MSRETILIIAYFLLVALLWSLIYLRMDRRWRVEAEALDDRMERLEAVIGDRRSAGLADVPPADESEARL